MGDIDVWDPFRHLRRAEDRIKRLLEPMEPWGTGLREPLVDIVDRGRELQVIAELPGVEKKDIDLNVDEQSISIRAKSGFEAKEGKKEQGHYYHERRLQSFFRSIPLPVAVSPERANAEFRNGILTVSLPKRHPKEKPKGKKLTIK